MKLFKVTATVEKDIEFHIQAESESQLLGIMEGDEFKLHIAGAPVHDANNVGLMVEKIKEVQWNEQTSRETSR